ncbi:MAG: glycosyltransferase family 39 protein [Armatimonadota bacterium]|nr:glycosyltransferase family 39 protein [Armatimonadota bacterium]
MLLSPHRERLWFALLLLGTALLAFWSLGSLPLVDVDEPVYGQVGKEMAHAGLSGWLTPHYGGQFWFDKPPLFYWLTALSMRGFGVSEFAARLPSALLSVALVAVTYALARRAYPPGDAVTYRLVRRTYPPPPRSALWAGFALATCVQFFLLARAAVTDMTLAVTLTGALLALYVWTQTDRGRWIALAGALTGLAALTKGPVALVLIGVQTIAYLCLTRQAKRLLSPALWGGFALCLLVGLPWFLLMIHLHGKLFIDGFLEANNVTRYLQAEHKETSPFWFFLPVLLGGFFPWSLALPGALVLAWRQGREAWQAQVTDNPALFLGLWIALVFVFFSASQSKLITYIFPLYPTAAVLVGSWLAYRPEALARIDPLKFYAAANLLLLFPLWKAAVQFDVSPVTLRLWLLILVLSVFAIVAFGKRRGTWLIPGTVTALFLLIAWCSPTWKVREADISERKLAAVAAQTSPPDEVIHALGFKHPSLRYYSARPVVYTDDHPASAEDIRQHPGVVYAMRIKDEDDLRGVYHVTNYQELWRYDKTVLIQATPAKAPEVPKEKHSHA